LDHPQQRAHARRGRREEEGEEPRHEEAAVDLRAGVHQPGDGRPRRGRLAEAEGEVEERPDRESGLDLGRVQEGAAEEMTAPLVSCLCVTEDRPAFVDWLLWNFDKQDYANREL